MTSITIWTYEITVLIFQWTTVLLLENNLYARKSTTIGFWHITTKVLSFCPSGRYFGQTLICPSLVKTLKQEILYYQNIPYFYTKMTNLFMLLELIVNRDPSEIKGYVSWRIVSILSWSDWSHFSVGSFFRSSSTKTW